MTEFHKLSETMFASPQIDPSDLFAARDCGVTLVVNNRPDGEDPDAPQGEEIETAAREAGLDYIAIPIGRSGFSEPQVDMLVDALDKATGKVLGYCRTGTRSTLLWALARAKAGDHPDQIEAAASSAGYDISPVRPMVDMLAAR